MSAIDKQAAINKLKERLIETALNNVGIMRNVDEVLVDVAEERLENWFDEVPSAQQWVPCSERMPKEKDAGILKKIGKNRRSDYVLATVEVKGERMTVTSCTQDGVWDWNMKYAFPDYKVVAWMPLPKPYVDGKDNSHDQ